MNGTEPEANDPFAMSKEKGMEGRDLEREEKK